MKNSFSRARRGYPAVFISVLLIGSACFFGGSLSKYLGGFAVVSAGVFLPEGGRAAAMELLASPPSGSPAANAAEKNSGDTGTGIFNRDPDSLPKNASDVSYLIKTPDDIISAMLGAERDFIKGPEALEKQFSSADGTDSYELISLKNTTASKSVNIESLAARGIEIDIKDNFEPLVLIYHSHTTESYCLLDNGFFPKGFGGRAADSGRNMARIGAEIARELEGAGISVLHETKIFDESYSDAYDLSRAAVKEYLEKYPSIQITIDVHRDAIHYSADSYCKPTAEIMGKKAAQIMILTGAEEGKISDFPNWEQNLSFALTLYNYAENMYKGLMKPIFFCQRKYNMDLGRYSLLLEVGADANTLEEAVFSGRLIGNALAAVINDYS